MLKRNQVAEKVFESHLNKVALYREGRSITLCKIVRFEVGEHLVEFDAEPLGHAGFGECPDPWQFSIQWDYFFYDSKYCMADSQFLRWRVDFDDARIQKLCDYALTLSPDLEPSVPHAMLDEFFTCGEDG